MEAQHVQNVHNHNHTNISIVITKGKTEKKKKTQCKTRLIYPTVNMRGFTF